MHDNRRSVDVNVAGPSMLANLMTAAVAYAVQRGVSLEQIAEAAELGPADLIATSDRVPEDAVSRILRLLQERFPDEPVALEMAAAAPVSFLGPLAPVARLVPDLRSGIEVFVQYRSVLSTSVDLELIEEPPGPMLRFEHPNDLEFGPQGAEMALLMGARSVAEVFGIPDAVRLVWVGHEPTGPEQRYEAAFAAPVRFNAPFDALLFHASRLDHPVDPEGGTRLRIMLQHLELARQEIEPAGGPGRAPNDSRGDRPQRGQRGVQRRGAGQPAGHQPSDAATSRRRSGHLGPGAHRRGAGRHGPSAARRPTTEPVRDLGCARLLDRRRLSSGLSPLDGNQPNALPPLSD